MSKIIDATSVNVDKYRLIHENDSRPESQKLITNLPPNQIAELVEQICNSLASISCDREIAYPETEFKGVQP